MYCQSGLTKLTQPDAYFINGATAGDAPECQNKRLRPPDGWMEWLLKTLSAFPRSQILEICLKMTKITTIAQVFTENAHFLV